MSTNTAQRRTGGLAGLEPDVAARWRAHWSDVERYRRQIADALVEEMRPQGALVDRTGGSAIDRVASRLNVPLGDVQAALLALEASGRAVWTAAGYQLV